MAIRDVPGFEFFIRDAEWTFSKEVYLIERTANESFLITVDSVKDGDVLIKRTPIKPHEPIQTPPLFRLGMTNAGEILQALQKALDQQHLPKPSEDRMSGQLEAIKEHLKDMRRLVFEPMTERVVLERKEHE